MKTVSIIIPCYNAAPFLRETLDSAIGQTHPALEVILVDDGSTDDSARIAESYAPPVQVIRQTNHGESVAMNAALAIARGDYVVFLGADDVLHPELLETQLRTLERDPRGVACTGFAFFTDDITKAFGATMPHAKAFFPEIISGNLAPPSCWMAPRDIVIQAGCYHGPQRYFEDWDLWWRVGLTGAAYVPVDFVGFYYRQHVRSQLATAKNADRAYGHAVVMERMCRALLDRPDLLRPYGSDLFWASCAALRACRAFAVEWSQLRLLTNLVEEITRRKPIGLEHSTFARAVRMFGFRRAEMVGRIWRGAEVAPKYRAKWLAAEVVES